MRASSNRGARSRCGSRLPRRGPHKRGFHAADLIVKAIVKRVSTGFGRFSEVTYATAPMILGAIVNTGYKLFPDARAARRDGGKQAEQKAFERATGARIGEGVAAMQPG
jgi:hypothetical protein